MPWRSCLLGVILAAAAAPALVHADRSPPHPARPTAAAGGQRVLFRSDWSGTGEVYAADPAGTGPVGRLTPGRPAGCTERTLDCGWTAVPSPDGRHVAYWSYTGGAGVRLFVAAADGSAARRLASRPGGSFTVEWSPDSRHLAYFGGTSDGTTHVVGVDGRRDRVIATAPPTSMHWSPDSRHLAYSGGGAVCVVAAEERAPRCLAGSPADEVSWAPDSRRLAYVDAGVVEVAGVDGAHRRPLLATGLRADGAARWSPAGGWIAYQEAGSTFLIRPDGTGSRRIADGTSDPEWSSDGRFLAFEGSGERVHVVDVRTGAGHVVGTSLGGNAFAWSPARPLLAIRSPDGLELADAAHDAARRLTAEYVNELSWSPDGRRLAYLAASGYEWAPNAALRVADLGGAIRTIVRSSGAYGGSLGGLAWARRPPGVRYRPAGGRAVARTTADGLVAPFAIEALATDGDRVAYAACSHVFLWTPATGARRQVDPDNSLAPTCPLGGGGEPDVYTLALSTDRVVFGERGGGNRTVAWLGGMTLAPTPTAFTLGTDAWTTGCIASPLAGGLGNAVATGSRSFFSTWSEDCAAHPPATTTSTILRVDPGAGVLPIRAAAGPLVPFDADAGRVAAGGAAETEVLDESGGVLRSVQVSPLAVQLSGNDLVVLVPGAFRDYDATTGALLHRWPAPGEPGGAECWSPSPTSAWQCGLTGATPRLVLEDAARGLVAYVLDGQVHLLRLADGVDAAVGPGTLARFASAGLVYADGAALHLVPFAKLPLGP